MTLVLAGSGITPANLADGTDGEMITWNASGVPAAVAVGTSTHVLTSNGAGAAPTFQAAAAGGSSSFIESVAATSGATILLSHAAWADATYFRHRIDFSNIHPSQGSNLTVEIEDGGSVITSAYYGGGILMQDHAQTLTRVDNDADIWPMGTPETQSSAEGLQGYVEVIDPTVTKDLLITGRWWWDDVLVVTSTEFTGGHNTQGEITGLRFGWDNASTFSTGEFVHTAYKGE